ncbi:MAG: glycerol-3-phosphate 1-O-acyltransferase PlsY [Alphaproteobacteria bacterium]|nr:glycerol-3-phosphate 1-O-acyltransferase PlsY [Alphaproteobacteria bacterium]
MNALLPWVISLAAGYLLGSIPFGLVITRLAGTGDIRQIGSGSIGATNVLRTGRKSLAAATLLLDAGKGAAAVFLGWHLVGPNAGYAAGVLAVVGHMFPVWLGFKGGKGVATGVGVLLAANWGIALICGAIWLAVAFTIRISSASALAASAAAPVVAAVLQVPFPLLIATTIVAALIWQRHKDNIARLAAGTEPRIGKK